MKRLCIILSVLLAFAFVFGGCSKRGSDLTVGLLTDGGEVNDYSLNEAAWNGIVLASSKFGVNGIYSVPGSADTDGFISSIKELYDGGARMIVAVSYIQSEAIKKARFEYKDCIFVCVGFSPVTASNVAALTFAENEAAFIAGFASAQTLKSGDFAAILGMDVPSARRYSGGFKAGIAYSNKNYGTKVDLKEENIIYVGSYNDVNAAATLSEKLYRSGVRCIFADGGVTSSGIFETAKALRGSGTEAWVVGAVTDKYNDGVFEGNRSVTLTSAVSRIGSAIAQTVGAYLKDDLDASSPIVFDCSNECVGIPTGDANIPKEIREECDEITKLIADKTVTVPDEWASLPN